MGCLWSLDEVERCEDCNRKAVNNLIVVNNTCEICEHRRSKETYRRSTVTPGGDLTPRFGEYKCSCGRFWNSRYARAQMYLLCERCRKRVYPHNLRDLRPSDLSGDKENHEEHKTELCQMCQQLGHHCGKRQRRARSVHTTRFHQKSKSKSKDMYNFSL